MFERLVSFVKSLFVKPVKGHLVETPVKGRLVESTGADNANLCMDVCGPYPVWCEEPCDAWYISRGDTTRHEKFPDRDVYMGAEGKQHYLVDMQTGEVIAYVRKGGELSLCVFSHVQTAEEC